jgi:2-dehydro-3-deoxygluconokinase
MIRVCSFGEIVIKLIPIDRTVFSSLPNKVNYSYYSSELNFLIDISIFGIKTYFISALPENFIGQSVLRTLDSYRINRENVLTSKKGRIGIRFEEEGYGSRMTSTYYDRAGSTIDYYKYQDYNFKEMFEKSNIYHISSNTPAISNDLMNCIINSTRLAKEMGLEVSLDLNYNINLWKYSIKHKNVIPEKIISDIAIYCDYLFCCENDLREFFGIDIRKKANSDDVIAHYQNLLLQISKRFPNIHIISMLIRNTKIRNNSNNIGGVLYIRETNQFFFSPNIFNKFKPIAIDSSFFEAGEREAFYSGLIYGLKKYKGVQHALDFAVSSALLKYTHSGDINYSNANEVNQFRQSSKFRRLRRG